MAASNPSGGGWVWQAERKKKEGVRNKRKGKNERKGACRGERVSDAEEERRLGAGESVAAHVGKEQAKKKKIEKVMVQSGRSLAGAGGTGREK